MSGFSVRNKSSVLALSPELAGIRGCSVDKANTLNLVKALINLGR